MPDNANEQTPDPNAPQQPPAPAPAPVPAPVPTPVVSPPQMMPAEMPVVKTESRPRPDGGYDVTERTEMRRTIPPVMRNYPTLQYGQHAPQPPAFRPAPVQSSGADYESATRFFDECARSNEAIEWEVEVRRLDPDRWPEKRGPRLILGEIARWPLDTFQSLKKRVINTFGGGKYKLVIRDNDNHSRRSVEIQASTINHTPVDPQKDAPEENEEMKPQPAAPQTPEEEAIERAKRQKELLRQESEIEITKAENEEKLAEIQRRRKAREEGVPQVEALRDEMKQGQTAITQVIQAMQQQTTQLLTMMQQQAAQQQQQMQSILANQNGGVKEVLALVANKPDSSKEMLAAIQARSEREDQLRREQAEREERYRQEEKVREEKRHEREEQLRREQAAKDEQYRREREDREERHRQDEKEQQRQFVTMMMQMNESRNKESVPQMNLLMESIKALNEGNKTFIQAVIETGKSSKGDLAETQKANAALVERTFQTIMESQKGDAGKYERLMEALISNKLEAGQRGLQEFIQALQMGEDRAEKMFRMIREAEGGEEEAPPATPPVDTNQGFWNNLGNIVMAFLLSRSGNPDVQQGVAAALGRSNPAALTQSDYRQVAQGMTPLIAQQMGMQMPPGMIPAQQPQLPMMPPNMMPPQPMMPQQPMMPPQQVQAPFPLPQAPGSVAPVSVPGMMMPPQESVAPVQPVAQDADAEERLRETLDEMVETACNDLADETREQQWTDYGLDYLPKQFLDRLVQYLDAKRLDLAVAELRRNTSIEKFARLETLVQNQSKYDLFLKGLIEMILDHKEASGNAPVAPMPPSSNVIPMSPTQAPVQIPAAPNMPVAPMPIPTNVPVAPMPVPIPGMPEPASGPPASAVQPVVPAAPVTPIAIPPTPLA